ncbi:MAG: SMP-30/gluconolactonase/LRE family protein, partial [Acidimicrobiales bacterium]
MPLTFDVALDARDSLGEGPWWDQRSGELLRVDILQRFIHRWNPATGSTSSLDVGEDVGFAVPTQGGNLIAGLRSGLSIIDNSTIDSATNSVAGNDAGSRELLCPIPGSSPARFNDGKTDRAGRIWAGTIVDDQSEPDAVFGRLHADRFVPVLDGFSISNGLGWSPDSTTMYVTDSGVKTIWAFDFDDETLELTNRRPFVVDTDYTPDGLTVDAEGGVWSAKWDGSRVVR